jgi:hypothetical protein
LAQRTGGGANCVHHRQTSLTRRRTAVTISAERTRGLTSSRDPRRHNHAAHLRERKCVSIGRLPSRTCRSPPNNASRIRATPTAHPGFLAPSLGSDSTKSCTSVKLALALVALVGTGRS